MYIAIILHRVTETLVYQSFLIDIECEESYIDEQLRDCASC